ncbi:hypothetical protein Taro_034135 [Colocasia esculenta]|uniref:Uncharacterized protein n=1 Tax=Colocasia esculenta TaxID=4460 RepID=A0A843VVN3_COLES|nr:hypothetical protein [Colocasia esculenta]
MERHKPIPQPFFPCCIRTPKTHRCLNTLHPNPRDEFRTCWGHVEELLVAGELWIIHKKLIFFPRSSATTCTNCPLEVDQSLNVDGACKGNPGECGGGGCIQDAQGYVQVRSLVEWEHFPFLGEGALS